MANAENPTWLSLDRWAAILGISPLSFNQLTSSLYAVGDCGEVWFSTAWQNTDQASRDDVSEAILEAEERLTALAGYNLLPDWTADERLNTVRPARPELFSHMVNVRGQLKSVPLRWSYIISGGQKQKDLIEADIDVSKAGGAILDLDGDTYFETVRFTVNVADADLNNACELRVFLPASDAVIGTGGLDEWEVRPIKVTIAGNIATVEFKRWQIVLPRLQLIINTASINGDLDASYLDAVDIYRVWNDPQSMAQLLWEVDNDPVGCSSCGGAGCVSCAFNAQTGCIHVRNERLGLVAYTPATWDATNDQFIRAVPVVCRDPDQLRLWYYSGYQSDHPRVTCPRVQLDPFWEKIIAYYACGLLDRPICSCNNIERFVDYWRTDLSRLGREVSHQVSPSDLDNPLGTTRGAVEAWRKVNGPNSDWIVKR